MMTDPIADMLTRVRNASGAKVKRVDMAVSKLKTELARILKENDELKAEQRALQSAFLDKVVPALTRATDLLARTATERERKLSVACNSLRLRARCWGR